MNIKFQIEKLEKTINAFYRATGIRLAILDEDFSNIVSIEKNTESFCSIIHSLAGESRCAKSDREILKRCAETALPQLHVCHAGLIDIALPIMHNGQIMGYIIMGQMKRNIPFSALARELAGLGKENFSALEAAYENMVVYDDERAGALAELAVMLASYIMTENMIKQDYGVLTEKITGFIRENLNNSLSVDEICRKTGVSKNTLYRNVRMNFNVSVNELVTRERIASAKELLRDTKEPINRICEKVGISDSSYFCKVFKEKTGMTPSKYRKSLKNKEI